MIGSGPFIFKRDEWKPGEKIVYVKNPKYKPRSEPASGLAGGKVVKLDRVEWIVHARHQTAVNALLNGEIDMIESPRPRPAAACWPRTRTSSWSTPIRSATSTPSASTCCTSRSTTRRSVTPCSYAFNQEDFLKATIGDPKWYKVCKAMFVCGTPLETTEPAWTTC